MEFKFPSTPLEEDLYNQNIIELHVVDHHDSVEKSFLLNRVASSKDLSTSPYPTWWLVCYLSVKELNPILNTVFSSFHIVKKKKKKN